MRSPVADAGRTHISVLEHEKSVDLSGDSTGYDGIQSIKYGKFLGLQEERVYLDPSGNVFEML